MFATSTTTEKAVKFVTRNRKRPFFLYLPTNAPHGPRHVPIEYTADYVDALLIRIQDLRLLERALNAEGRLAEAEGRTPDAIRSYLDTIHLGRAVGNGGLIINRLVGLAVEEFVGFYVFCTLLIIGVILTCLRRENHV